MAMRPSSVTMLCRTLLLLLWSLSLPALGAAGIIQRVLGDAHVSDASGLERPAQRGVQLYDGDAVWTGKLSNVQIRMIDDAIIWVYPESRLKIRSYSKTDGNGFKGEHAVLSLLMGGLRTVTGSIKNSYSMTTPNAVLGIRGTDYAVVFIAAGAVQDPRGEPGTYNRVFQGETFMQSGQFNINILQGQAGFVPLQPGAAPRLLPTIPLFLNGSPTAPPPPLAAPTSTTATPPPVAAPTSTTATPRPTNAMPVSPAAAPRRQLLLTIRVGDPPDNSSSVTTSSRRAADGSQEQSILVLDGERAFISTTQGTPAYARPLPGITGVQGQSGTQLELRPSLSGDRVIVSINSQMQLSSPGQTGPAQSQQIATTISIPLGEWVEVTGRSPWTSTQDSETTSSRGSRRNMSRIFLKVDDTDR